MSYRVVFDRLPWDEPMPGVRHKLVPFDGRRLRLVEYRPEMPLHWCEAGHAGVVLEGRFEIEYEGETHVYEPGDGIVIPAGAAHRHRARVLTDVVRAVFVEDA